MEKQYSEKEIKNLVNKLFSGKINSDELQILNDWYDLFNSLEELEIPNTETSSSEEIKYKLLANINHKRKRNFNVFDILYQYKNIAAAIFIFVLLLASISILLKNNSGPTKIVWNEFQITNGKKKIITLSDNSKITINSGSYFKYPKSNDPNKFEVFLDGEAYFEIAPNKNRKFIVHTSTITTTVLGTKFNVNAFKNEDEHSVSLIEGKVEIENISNGIKNNKTILNPLEQYVSINNNNNIRIKSFIISEEVGWKDNILIFNKKSLKQILKVLSRNYGVTFILTNDDYAKRKVTANFNDASLSTVIRSIQKLTNLKSYIEKDYEKQMVVFY